MSHNELDGLYDFISGPAQFFHENLETLILVNIGKNNVTPRRSSFASMRASSKLNNWLHRSLASLQGLYELDVSENAGIEVDQLLLAIQES